MGIYIYKRNPPFYNIDYVFKTDMSSWFVHFRFCFISDHCSIISDKQRESKEDEENAKGMEGTPLLSDQNKLLVTHEEGM